MKNALIIHGAYGNPSENWFPWLKSELEALHYVVSVPQFPTPENQNLAAWLEVAEQYLEKLDSDSLIIGHSIGATFILSLLEKLERPINHAVLVAGFISDLPDSSLNEINHTFYDRGFVGDVIRSKARHLTLFHSPDDPFVPIGHAEQLAHLLQTPLTEVPDAGHFNLASGYHQFPEILETIGHHIK